MPTDKLLCVLSMHTYQCNPIPLCTFTALLQIVVGMCFPIEEIESISYTTLTPLTPHCVCVEHGSMFNKYKLNILH